MIINLQKKQPWKSETAISDFSLC